MRVTNNPRSLVLDSQQLTSGHVYYRSSAERIQFQLEIVDQFRKGLQGVCPGTVFKAAILSYTGRASADRKRAKSDQESREHSHPQHGCRCSSAREGHGGTTQTPAHTSGIYTTLPGALLRGQVPAIVLDQPPAVAGDTALPLAVGVPATLNNLPPPPPVNEPRATQQIRIGGNLQAANLIKRVAPLYPPVALIGPRRRNCPIHGPNRQRRHRSEFASGQRYPNVHSSGKGSREAMGLPAFSPRWRARRSHYSNRG